MKRVICIVLALTATSTLIEAATSARAQSPAERSFPASGFDAIETNASDNVEVVLAPTTSVIARGDPAAVASLQIEVRGGTLRIGRTPGTHRDRGATIFVTVPMLRATTTEGSGSIRATSLRGRRLAASVSGSGDILLPGLAVSDAELSVNGSGSISAQGVAEQVELTMDGSGSIDTQALKTPVIAIRSDGSGKITATASRTARIQLDGSGDVRVTGHPLCQISGSGGASFSRAGETHVHRHIECD